MSTQEQLVQQNADLTLTVEDHHAVLCDILKLHATKWREIGLNLGFLPGHLDNIQGAPLLLQTAPVSWMNVMLEKFIKEREGEPMMSVLVTALKKAGLGLTASQLKDDVQRLVLAQGHSAVTNFDLSPVQKYAKRLKELYFKHKMPDYLKGRQLRTANFVSLALISREGVSKQEVDQFTCSTVNDGNIDGILIKKAPIEMKHIGKLKAGSSATCMVLQGGPGVGKTTLVWNLCRAWESGEQFQEYSLVIFIPLRRKDIREAKEVKELLTIGNSDSETQGNIIKELLNNQGESVLLVLDGYDELPEDMQQDSVIAKVVSGELLPKASVLVTSRSSACDMLCDKCFQRDENFQHIELLGFTKDNIKAYIEDNVDSKQLPQLNKYLSSHPKVQTMMYNPLQCAFTVEVCKKMFKEASVLPRTRTKLYETNVLMTISREHSSVSRRTNSLQKLPKALYEKFVKLCRLAFDGIIKRQVIFDDVPEEIEEVGLLVCEPELDSVLPSSQNFNFFHLSIQEFCAAYYICNLSKQEQTAILSCHCKERHFQEVVIFVCGMSNDPERIISTVFSKASVSEYVKNTQSGSSHTTSYSFCSEDTIFLLHCAFESQSRDTCSNLMKKLKSKITLSFLSLTLSDMSALGFVLCKSGHQCKELLIYKCLTCGADGMQALINQFHCTLEEHSSLSIKTIDLRYNSIGDNGVKYLSEGLKYFPELQKLNVSGNNIGDDGAKSLSGGLQYCPELQELNLTTNKIGDNGVNYLSEVGLKYCPNLQVLTIAHNKIGNDGAKCLSAGLKHCTKLQTLYVVDNSISDEGRAALEMTVDEMNSKREPNKPKLVDWIY